jgi:hypothetical protein
LYKTDHHETLSGNEGMAVTSNMLYRGQLGTSNSSN